MVFYDNNLVYVAMCIATFALQLFWMAYNNKKDSTSTPDKKTQLFTDIVFCMCMALTVGTLFRLFPGNHRIPAEDSSVFLYIGKRMTEGKIPYLELFDHKGPILYFIEYLGLAFSREGYTGVWILEVLSILASIVLMRKLGEVITDRNGSIYLAIFISIGVCGWKVWQGGNYTEEYALPWITLSAWIFFSFFKTGCYSRYKIALLGFSFSIVFLLRANMIGVWMAFIPIVLFLLVKKQRFAEIGVCMACFSVGAAIVLLPVIIYAVMTNSFHAMWNDYIVFNFVYTGASAVPKSNVLILSAYFAKVVWPGTLAFVICLSLNFKKKILWLNAVFFLVSLYSASMSGRGYYHYAIILLPSLVLPLTELFDMTARWLNRLADKGFYYKSSAMILSFLLIMIGAFLYRIISSGDDTGEDPVLTYIQNNTFENDDVLVLGNSCWYYLLSERKTENRYFYQLPPAEISEEIYNSFIRQLTEHPSKLIILPGMFEEREWINMRLKGIRDRLSELSYSRREYETFEAFILN